MKTIVLKVSNLPKNVDTDLFVYCMKQDVATSYPRGKVELVPDLLKEQEAVKPRVDAYGTFNCGNCGEPVGFDEHPFTCKVPEIAMKFCCECGKPVKWDD